MHPDFLFPSYLYLTYLDGQDLVHLEQALGNKYGWGIKANKEQKKENSKIKEYSDETQSSLVEKFCESHLKKLSMMDVKSEKKTNNATKKTMILFIFFDQIFLPLFRFV